MSPGSGRVPALAFALVALTLLTAVPAPTNGAPSTTDASLAGASPSSATLSAIPAVLHAPWSTRAGFDPVDAAVAAAARPSTDANVQVVITFQPTNPSFFDPSGGGAPLTSAQIADSFGPSAASYQALIAYFAAHGVSVVHTWPDRLSLTVEGSSAALGAAFDTTLENGTWGGVPVRFPALAPALPAPFESEIAAVSGLSAGFNRFTVPLSEVAAALPGAARTTLSVTPSAVHLLYDLDGLYNYSGAPHFATGVGIALVLWGQGYDPSDIAGFYQSYYPGGFPAVTVAPYPVDGAPAPSAAALNDPSNVTSEMTLDIEWSGSAAPGATIDAVYAPDGPASNGYSPSDANLEDAMNKAVQSIAGVQVISMSFGTPDGSDPSFQAAYEVALSDAANRGITVLAASGDTGGTAKVGCVGGISPEFPAASPYTVAVGGTAPTVGLDAFGQVTGLASEPAWNRSGGGFSVSYSAPSWQAVGSAAAQINASGHRGIPDVAGPAQDNVFYYGGQQAAGAGTSFAAPMWAGIVAEMDAIRGVPLGFLTPRLYTVGVDEVGRSSGVGLVDITSGANCLGPATAGWDTSTGWGSPRGLALYEDLSATFANVSLSLSSPTVAPGGSVSATVHVTNASSNGPLAGLAVLFTLDSPGYVGPCGGAIDSISTTTDQNGNASASLGIPGCFLGTSAQITATVSGSYFGSNTTTVKVNLVGLAGFLAAIQVFPYNLLAFAGIIAVAVLAGWRIGEWRHRRNRPPRPGGPPPTGDAPPTSSGEPRGPSANAGPPSLSVGPRAAVTAVRPLRPPSPPGAGAAPRRPTPAAAPEAPPASRPAMPPVSAAADSPTTPPAGPASEPRVPDHVANAAEWAAPTPIPPPSNRSSSDTSAIPEHLGGSPSTPPTLPPEFACPKCGAPNAWSADRCRSCGGSLWAPGDGAGSSS